MTKQEFLAWLGSGPHLLDGATGSELLARGMPRGEKTELWIDRHPEALLELQQAYVQAGCQVIYAPTFQAQAISLEKAGFPARDTEALNARLVRLSRRAAEPETLVAGDLATLAADLPSWEPERLHEMTELYRRQIGGILEGGADLLAAETLLYPTEAEAFLQAVELEGSGTAVLITFTMDADGSFFSGRPAGPVLRELEEAGASAVGFNCVNAGSHLPALVSRLRRQVQGPLISKPNAGDPVIDDRGRAVYSMDPASFAAFQVQAASLGAKLLGGCCGTTPAHMAALASALRDVG